jgi:hypothetical protein
LILIVVLNPGEEMLIGEVFVDGQNRNVWCNSKTPITDLSMYNTPSELTNPVCATTPSCYVLRHFSVTSNVTMELRIGSTCLSSYYIIDEFMLCE